jgi:hypothetical protein
MVRRFKGRSDPPLQETKTQMVSHPDKRQCHPTLAEPRPKACAAPLSKLNGGVRGKYVECIRAGTNLVGLSPDVAKHFPDEQSVNQALRGLIHAANGTLRRATLIGSDEKSAPPPPFQSGKQKAKLKCLTLPGINENISVADAVRRSFEENEFNSS